jgi:hypothetical protein
MGDYEAVLGEVRRSDMMRGIWSSYVSASPYAEGVDFEEAVDSAIELARLSELGDWTDRGEKSLTAPISDDCAIDISPIL